MSPKRSTSSQDFGSEPKRRRKMLTIAEKVELLDMLKEGQSYASVGHHCGINESSIRHIKKDEKNVRKTASVTFNKKTPLTHFSCEVRQKECFHLSVPLLILWLSVRFFSSFYLCFILHRLIRKLLPNCAICN
uniref:HTH psq-type domain-containing protein n=1 Tax=Monopterus albus TaxID=43700 RepID=A0A3Q3K3G5_MONAL